VTAVADQPITVTVADDHASRIHDVADRLRAAGMRVDQVLGAAGVITGSVPGPRRPAIEALPGVAAVEDERSFQIAPPDADVQ
jgi:hypothetical protein